MSHVRDILKALDEYHQTPESHGMKLRLNLAQIILRHIKENNWTQKELATKTSFKDSFISRLLHSDANCTFETAGRILFALGVEAKLEEVRATHSSMEMDSSGHTQAFSRQDQTDGKKIFKIQETKIGDEASAQTRIRIATA